MLKNNLVNLRYALSLIIIVIAFPFFFLGGATESSTELMSAIWNCGHLIFFIAFVILVSKKFDITNWRVWIGISLAVFFGGGLIEVIQSYTGRDGNWDDLLRDLTGTWLGLFWIQPARKWIWVGRILSVVLLIPNLTAVFFESWFQFNAKQNFPLLGGFESFIEMQGRNAKTEARSTAFHTQGNYSLKVQLTTRPYSGIKFNRLPRDWRSFKMLKVDIYNPDSQPLKMTVRVNDLQHKDHGWKSEDRFNQKIELEQGWNHFGFALDEMKHAPATREMDLATISWIEIFTSKLPEQRLIYLDNLRLE